MHDGPVRHRHCPAAIVALPGRRTPAVGAAKTRFGHGERRTAIGQPLPFHRNVPGSLHPDMDSRLTSKRNSPSWDRVSSSAVSTATSRR